MLMEMGELVGRSSSSSRRPESELDWGGGVSRNQANRTWVDLNSAYAMAAA